MWVHPKRGCTQCEFEPRTLTLPSKGSRKWPQSPPAACICLLVALHGQKVTPATLAFRQPSGHRPCCGQAADHCSTQAWAATRVLRYVSSKRCCMAHVCRVCCARIFQCARVCARHPKMATTSADQQRQISSWRLKLGNQPAPASIATAGFATGCRSMALAPMRQHTGLTLLTNCVVNCRRCRPTHSTTIKCSISAPHTNVWATATTSGLLAGYGLPDLQDPSETASTLRPKYTMHATICKKLVGRRTQTPAKRKRMTQGHACCLRRTEFGSMFRTGPNAQTELCLFPLGE